MMMRQMPTRVKTIMAARMAGRREKVCEEVMGASGNEVAVKGVDQDESAACLSPSWGVLVPVRRIGDIDWVAIMDYLEEDLV
jgi:hypothetical protein